MKLSDTKHDNKYQALSGLKKKKTKQKKSLRKKGMLFKQNT